MFASVQLQAQEPELATEVKTALQENADALSPITVSWSQQMHSQLSQEETLARLKHPWSAREFFFKTPYRVSWQDEKIYCYREKPNTMEGKEVVVPREEAIDGTYLYTKVSNSNYPSFFKRFLSEVVKEEAGGSNYKIGYFLAAGLRLPLKMEEWSTPRATSDILYLLSQDGQLRSVETAVIDGRELLRIEVSVENAMKRAADAVDLEEMKQNLELRSDAPEQREKLWKSIERRRQLPARRQILFFLDPDLHYALRRREERYEPDTLLLRCDCSDFEKQSDRDLWLPRKCAIHHYTYDTIPGTFLKEPIVSELFDVKSFDLQPVSDDVFVLDSLTPGTRVADGTIADAVRDDTGFTRYVVPARADDLAVVIENARIGKSGRPPERFSWSPWLITLNVSAAVAVLIYLFLRSRRAQGK